MKSINDPFHILIVEDDESQLALIRLFLQKQIEGAVQITGTTNSQQAIGLAVSNRVDICITDLDMPDRNGIELLKILKETNPLILVIVITAIASVNALKSSLAFGADDFLRKPLQWKSLVDSVQFQISRLKRYRIEINSIDFVSQASESCGSEKTRAALKLIYSLLELSGRLIPALESGKLSQLSMVTRQIELISAQGKLSKITLGAKELQRQIKEHSDKEHLRGCTQELSRLCNVAASETNGEEIDN
ncbi:MAG: response regulator [Pirellula sp.]|jgi:DNA-binding response OmpR family regulator|nr:response regulator [Pirellula sp.]